MITDNPSFHDISGQVITLHLQHTTHQSNSTQPDIHSYEQFSAKMHNDETFREQRHVEQSSDSMCIVYFCVANFYWQSAMNDEKGFPKGKSKI